LHCTGSRLGVTPFGLYPKECIHGVRSGSVLTNEKDHVVVTHPDFPNEIERIPRCKKHNSYKKKSSNDVGVVNGDGWQQYVKYQTNNITEFLGMWIVPDAPADFAAGVLFTFTGLQNIDWVPPNADPKGPFDIIQPVLQYGYSEAGGGTFWSMASWYVTLDSDVYYSRLTPISSKVTMFGNMTKIGGDSWFIDSVDTSTNTHSSLTVTESILESQPWAYVTLEVYDIFACNEYPTDTIPYSNLELYVLGKQVSPAWVIGTNGQVPPICNSSISLASPYAVTIHF